MPRIARQASPTGYYHVFGRGHNRRAIFYDERDYHRYLADFHRFQQLFPCRCYHFCLMPNHFHFLLEAVSVELLTGLMRRTLQAYQFHWRRRYKLVGHLWQGRFKSIPIEKESYLLECARYIERNPVRAGLCPEPQEYPWSSAKAYLTGGKEEWNFLDCSPAYKSMGESEPERRQRYGQFIGQTRAYEEFIDAQIAQLT